MPSSERDLGQADDITLAYIGSSRGSEKFLMNRSDTKTFLFPMAPPTDLRGMVLLGLATLRAVKVLVSYRPRVTFATGGYVSVPAALASWLLRIPLVLFLPDVVPGKAVRWLVPLARRVAVSTEDSLPWLPRGRVVVTGYPTRASFSEASRGKARDMFGVPPNTHLVCVFGGSLGSQSINDALVPLLPELLSRCFVLHVAGERRIEEVRKAVTELPEALSKKYLLHPYLDGDDMAAALAAADLAVCRSGASVLGELPATATPAILIPLHIPGVHQQQNAEYLSKRGAAIILDNSDLYPQLGPTLKTLLADPARLQAMTAACRLLAKPGAAADIAGLIAREAL